MWGCHGFVVATSGEVPAVTSRPSSVCWGHRAQSTAALEKKWPGGEASSGKCVHVCTLLCVCVHMFMHAHVHMYMYVHVYTPVHVVNMCVHMCPCAGGGLLDGVSGCAHEEPLPSLLIALPVSGCFPNRVLLRGS